MSELDGRRRGDHRACTGWSSERAETAGRRLAPGSPVEPPCVAVEGWRACPSPPPRIAAGPLPRATHRRFAASGQLPGRAAAVGAVAGRPRRLLRGRRPARADRRGRAGRRWPTARLRSAAQLIAAGHRPGAVDGVPAVPCARAHPAGLDPQLSDRVRSGAADDPVQGQGRQDGRREHQRRAVHLPGADGRRHPALPVRPRAGRRGPAAAPGAHPRPGDAVQLPLRPDLRRARALHRAVGRQDPGPGRPDDQDEQVAVRAHRHHRAARRAHESTSGRSSRRSPTPGARSPSTR